MKQVLQTITCSSIVKLSCVILLFSIGATPVWSLDMTGHHLVVLGDPHLPGKYIESKERVIQTINSWADVEMVVAVGDICSKKGSTKEYVAARQFFNKLKKPLYPIAGNHDFYFDDKRNAAGRLKRGTSTSMDAKLTKFRQTFQLPSISYTKKIGDYFLVFLSAEGPGSTELNKRQLQWLRHKLEKNSKTSTIIFCHAPLEGTLRRYNKFADTANFIAQPAAKLRDILTKNPQVFLWVSGHTHTSPKEESFASPINLYENSVINIHNTDMNRKTIWTNSLFLYEDRVVVKTYNHKRSVWLPNIERTFFASMTH